MRMNRMITRKLREFSQVLRQTKSAGATNDELQSIKNEQLSEVYKMLTIHLGQPPQSFNWQVRNKDKDISRYENLTPQYFYSAHPIFVGFP